MTLVVKNLPANQCRRHKRCGFDLLVGKIPWRRAWQSTPVFLPGEFHGQGSLAGYSQGDRITKGRTQLKRLCIHTHTHTHTHTRRPRTLISNTGDSLPLTLLWLKGQLQRKMYLWHEPSFSSWGALFFELSFVEDYPHCSSQKGPLREKCYHGQNTFNSLKGKKKIPFGLQMGNCVHCFQMSICQPGPAFY